MTTESAGTGRRLLDRLDHYQRERPALGFPIAVLRKFGEDQAGNLAALISYYAFFSFFPLLLVLVTVLGFVAAGNAATQDRIMHTVSQQFPGLGQQIMPSGHTPPGSGFGLVVGIVLALWAGLAVANAAQYAFNTVWQVPIADRPTFVKKTLRSVALVALLGATVVVTTVVSGLSSAAGSFAAGLGLGTGGRLLLLAGSLLVNLVAFTLAFRVLTVRHVSTTAVLPGAVLAAVGWQVLLWVGGFVIGRKLSSAQATYGTFAIVIGLLTWFFLLGQLVLLATELNVVRARRLWPRSLGKDPVTDADRRIYRGYAAMLRFSDAVRVEVVFTDPPDDTDSPDPGDPPERADSPARADLPEDSDLSEPADPPRRARPPGGAAAQDGSGAPDGARAPRADGGAGRTGEASTGPDR